MKICNKCGAELNDDVKFCSNCGDQVDATAQEVENKQPEAESKTAEYQKKVETAVNDFMNTKDETSEFEAEDISKNKIFAVLSYISILFIIPLLAAPQSKFAKFHANQGLVLFIAEVLSGVVSSVLTAIFTFISFSLGALIGALFSVVSLVLFIFAIIGIVNAAQGKAKELPLIGNFRFIK